LINPNAAFGTILRISKLTRKPKNIKTICAVRNAHVHCTQYSKYSKNCGGAVLFIFIFVVHFLLLWRHKTGNTLSTYVGKYPPNNLYKKCARYI
jgi:hypothetical protein